MKKIIREVDEKRGIVQVTIADERWYLKPSKDEHGMPTIIGVPSVTWIAGSYPKGVQFYKWLADKGWDEAEAVKQAAADKGSKIHKAIENILKGEEVRIDSKFVNKSTEKEEELTLEECDAILAFKRWFDEVKPEVIVWEYTIFSEKHNYAGTIDFVCKIGDQLWIIDFKTGQYIWPEYYLQVSAYKEAVINGENPITQIPKGADVKTAILQIGYRKNKNLYKFTEIENKFDLFLAAQQIWRNEHGEETISKKDYPIVISPAIQAAQIQFEAPKEEVVQNVEIIKPKRAVKQAK